VFFESLPLDLVIRTGPRVERAALACPQRTVANGTLEPRSDLSSYVLRFRRPLPFNAGNI
jgi:hypothetical protein